MSRIIYPINNKLYTAEDVEIINSPRTSGVYSVLDFDLSLSGNVVTVGKGLGWIKNGDFKGKAVAFTEPETITLDSADNTLDRYDVVAVRYDATKTEPEIVIVKGEPSEAPVIPTRNTEVYLYELFLYSILRKAGEAVVDSNNVVDLRENEAYCGIMRDSVTSAVAPVYETLYDGEGLSPGDVVNFDVEKFESLIATVTSTNPKVSGDVLLRRGVDSFAFNTGLTTEPRKTFSGSNIFSLESTTDDMSLYLYVDLTYSMSGITVRKCTVGTNLTSTQTQYVKITKLVGVTKQPEGYVKVDSVYNPESHNAQSGEAVKQAIDEALEGFEGDDTQSLVNIARLIIDCFENVAWANTNGNTKLNALKSYIDSIENPDEPETPDTPDEPGTDADGYEVVRVLGEDEILHLTGYTDKAPDYYGEWNMRECYPFFDIPVEYDYTYKIEWETACAEEVGIGFQFYNQKILDYYVANLLNYDETNYTYISEWLANGTPFVLPVQSVNDLPIVGMRFNFKKMDDTAFVEGAGVTSVTIKRKAGRIE